MNQRNPASTWVQTLSTGLAHGSQDKDMHGKRDDACLLSGTIESDEGFFSVEISEEEKAQPRKRGRGSQSKATVLFMIESEPYRKHPDKGKGRLFENESH